MQMKNVLSNQQVQEKHQTLNSPTNHWFLANTDTLNSRIREKKNAKKAKK
jgi:hypothetical protein